jgi:hypothetical protein
VYNFHRLAEVSEGIAAWSKQRRFNEVIRGGGRKKEGADIVVWLVKKAML